MPFGLTNAPALFQHLIQQVPPLNPSAGPDFVSLYLDDILSHNGVTHTSPEDCYGEVVSSGPEVEDLKVLLCTKGAGVPWSYGELGQTKDKPSPSGNCAGVSHCLVDTRHSQIPRTNIGTSFLTLPAYYIS